MKKKIMINACICCGGDITVSYSDEMQRVFAEAVDVCPECYTENCSGISVVPADKDRFCKKKNNLSKPL